MRAGRRAMSFAGIFPLVIFACCAVNTGQARHFREASITAFQQDRLTGLGRSLLQTEAAPATPAAQVAPNAPAEPAPEEDATDPPPAAPDAPGTPAELETPAEPVEPPPVSTLPAVDDDAPAVPVEEVEVATEPPVDDEAPLTDAPVTAPTRAPTAPDPTPVAPAPVGPEPIAATPAPAPEPAVPPPPPPPPPPFFEFAPGEEPDDSPPGTSFAGNFTNEPISDDDDTGGDEPDFPDGLTGVAGQGQPGAQGEEVGGDAAEEEDNTTRNVGIAAAAIVGVLALAYIAWKIFGKKKAQPPADTEVDAQFNALAQSTGTIGGQAPPSHRSFNTNRSSARFTPPAAPIAEGVWTQM